MTLVVAMMLFAVSTHMAERSLGLTNSMGYESSKQSFDFSKRAQNTCKPHLPFSQQTGKRIPNSSKLLVVKYSSCKTGSTNSRVIQRIQYCNKNGDTHSQPCLSFLIPLSLKYILLHRKTRSCAIILGYSMDLVSLWTFSMVILTLESYSAFNTATKTPTRTSSLVNLFLFPRP
jgi:hypothetical protein